MEFPHLVSGSKRMRVGIATCLSGVSDGLGGWRWASVPLLLIATNQNPKPRAGSGFAVLNVMTLSRRKVPTCLAQPIASYTNTNTSKHTKTDTHTHNSPHCALRCRGVGNGHRRMRVGVLFSWSRDRGPPPRSSCTCGPAAGSSCSLEYVQVA